MNPPAFKRRFRPGSRASRVSGPRGLVRLVPLLMAWSFLQATAQDLDYARDIAPILRTYCAGCHNDQEFEGEFSVETYRMLRTGGDKGDPIRPGHADDSLLIKILEGRARPFMPPRDEPQVPDAERARLKQWIEKGADGPDPDVSLLQHLVVPDIAVDDRVTRPITAATVHPDGRGLALGRTGEVTLLSATSLEEPIRVIEEPELGKVHALAFSPDGSRLVAASGTPGLMGAAWIWDVSGDKPPVRLRGHRDVLYAAIFSPDGKLVATTGYDRTIRIWNVEGEEPELLRVIDGHEGAVFSLAFHPEGNVLASASADETVKLWRVRDGVRLDTLGQPQGEQTAVTFTRDGNRILSVGADRRIHVWRFVSREEPKVNPVIASRFAHGGAIRTFALSADGTRLITAADDRSVKLWQLPELTELAAQTDLSDVVGSLVPWSDRDTVYATRMDGSHGPLNFGDSLDGDGGQSVGVADRGVPGPGRTRGAEAGDPTESEELEEWGGSLPEVVFQEYQETEPNGSAEQAMRVRLPARIRGAIGSPQDMDTFRIEARAGEELTLEVNAARSGSKLDSHIEILTAEGQPLERVVLQAVRDSWFTFRGKDAFTSDDFRLHNWMEMELNEYLYANGEVVRLWLYPRGPDSGFKVYPGSGNRHTEFDTTPLAHPLGQPCYIVVPYPPGSQPTPNGLPIFRLNYENDDDATRRWGADSRLLFTAPADGEYLVRIRDVRGFGAPEGFDYTLMVRPRRPDFEVAVHGKDLKVSPGSGREVQFTATRIEGFDGAIQVDVENLPPGFHVRSPVTIESGQFSAVGVVYTDSQVENPTEEDLARIRVRASARIQGHRRTRDLGGLKLGVGAPAKVTVEIQAYDPETGELLTADASDDPLEFTLRPGETLKAHVRATRHEFEGRIELGGDDSGRNLPHGLYVDNIGLNGLLIVEGQNERDFFVTAAPIARPGTRWFHLRATADGGQASRPARITVLPVPAQASN